MTDSRITLHFRINDCNQSQELYAMLPQYVPGGTEDNRESAQTNLSLASRLQVSTTACSVRCHFQISVFPPTHARVFLFISPQLKQIYINGSVVVPEAFRQRGPGWNLTDFMSVLWWSGFTQFYRLFHNCLFITSCHRSLNIVVSFTTSLKYLWEVRTYVLLVTADSPSQDTGVKSASK
jgi:hypothetical protein